MLISPEQGSFDAWKHGEVRYMLGGSIVRVPGVMVWGQTPMGPPGVS